MLRKWVSFLTINIWEGNNNTVRKMRYVVIKKANKNTMIIK